MNNLSNESNDNLLEVENVYWADMWRDLESLHSDERFKRVILEGYFKDKAVNGVSMLAMDSVIQRGERSGIMEDLIGISSLQDHFITIQSLGAAPADDDDDEDEVG